MKKTKIEWCDRTWNPVTGCKRGCSYCYAKRIHDRFNKTNFSDVVFREDRLGQPYRIRKPQIIFVGSMSDIEYWDKKDLLKILKVCKDCSHHTFMFLSKHPCSYMSEDFCRIDWPKNTMQGLTIVKNDSVASYEKMSAIIELCPRPFLSIEPLQGEVYFTKAFFRFEKIIVGAMTGPGAIPPEPKWIQSIKMNVPTDKIFWKSNIKPYLDY